MECINQCKHHEHCSENEETYLPTRVIDCSAPSKPRLVQTNRQLRGFYCNLSYVWGGDQSSKTTLSNIDTYINEGITLPIPQTIADAISVTNKLGIKYLWVDALCIIQDSTEDKNKELGIMSKFMPMRTLLSLRCPRSAQIRAFCQMSVRLMSSHSSSPIEQSSLAECLLKSSYHAKHQD